jgi:hypothetical protein
MSNAGFYDTLDEIDGMSIYSGVWGVFPYFNDDRIIISDRVNGLYVLEYDNSSLLGDVNGDGMLNILDLVIISNIILETEDFVSESDVNQDGDVNILDLVVLVNIILAGNGS